MNYKSRGNYKPGKCMNFDCKNRDLKCKDCFMYRGEYINYEPKKDSQCNK